MLLFVLTGFLSIGMWHQSSASFFNPLSYLLWRLSFHSYTIFFGFFAIPKNNFWVFLSVPHLVDNYAKIVDERGWNFMCNRTLQSLLVLCKINCFFERNNNLNSIPICV